MPRFALFLVLLMLGAVATAQTAQTVAQTSTEPEDQFYETTYFQQGKVGVWKLKSMEYKNLTTSQSGYFIQIGAPIPDAEYSGNEAAVFDLKEIDRLLQVMDRVRTKILPTTHQQKKEIFFQNKNGFKLELTWEPDEERWEIAIDPQSDIGGKRRITYNEFNRLLDWMLHARREIVAQAKVAPAKP